MNKWQIKCEYIFVIVFLILCYIVDYESVNLTHF